MKLNKRIVKGVATTVVLAHMNMALQPLMAATQPDKGASSPLAQSQLKRMQALQRDLDEARAKQAQASASPADQASARLAQVEELVRDIAFIDREGRPDNAEASRPGQEQVRAIGPNLKAKVRPLSSEQKAQQQERRQQRLAELRELLASQQGDQQAVREEFAQTRRMLIERKLPEVILARHDEAVKTFEQRVASFNQTAARLQQGDASALGELQTFFDQNPTKRRAAPMDPKNLPWRTPEPTKRLPAETKTAWFQNLYGQQGTRVAQLGNSLAGLEFVTPPEPGQAPNEADLAETPETQRTAAIVAKAQELGNNPVNIQNWVRNNVEWVPTWGAIQSAQDTLDKKRGNAIDIASLEIALLRAARIPARYQFGTIELPAEQVMNWVGGVTKPEAAQQLLGQGGIANRGLIEGGKISKIRMEHAWVQAYVNWAPSRGARQGSATQHPSPVGPRNAWVPLDASFKQYEFLPKVNVNAEVPLDVRQLIEQASQGAVIDEANGFVQGFNASTVEQGVEEHAGKLLANLQQRHPGATIDTVLGRKIIPSWQTSLLNATLPFNASMSGAAVSRLPNSLIHAAVVRLYDSAMGRAMGDAVMDIKLPLHELRKRLSVTYAAATPEDQAVIDSANGQGPWMLPVYLIKMQGRLQLDGQTLKTLPVSTMGSPQYWAAEFYDPSGTNSGDNDFKVESAVGDEVVIGFNAAGVDGADIARRKTAVANQSAAETLHLTALNYWGLTDTIHDILGAHLGVRAMRLPSVGLFAQPLQVQYRWGVPSRGHYAGRMMDVRRSLIAAVPVDGVTSPVFMKAIGNTDSYLEGATFDLLFGHGVGSSASAVSVIEEANRQGLRIYRITDANFGQVRNQLSALPSGDLLQIEGAVAAGHEVVVPERPVQKGNWRGTGLIITDPETGGGAYLISGGSNGGSEDPCDKDPKRKPQPVELPDLGLLGKLFFALIMIVLAAAVIACVIGTAGICGGGLAPVLAAVGGLIFAGTATAQTLNFVPVQPLDGYGYLAWSSTYGKIYGPWFTTAVDAMSSTCDPATKAALQAAKNAACGKPLSCRGQEGCADYEIKINNGMACAGARIEVMKTCYPTGPGTFGDTPHINELGNVMKVLGRCMCEAAMGACPVQAIP